MVINILIFIALLAINYQLYYSFYMPEMARRRAFKALSEEKVAELKKTLTADHFFKLDPENYDRGIFKKVKIFTRK